MSGLVTRSKAAGGRNYIRDYRLFLPPTLDNTKPAPLVIILHGSPMTGDSMASVTHFDDEATTGGFLAVYPDGCFQDWDETDGSVDVQFISKLIDRLEGEFQIDKTKVFVVGFSAGGFMAYRLACDLSSQIAAVASDSGAMSWNDCQPARPISILEMHGTDDALVPYQGGFSGNGQTAISVPDLMQRWTTLDGCVGGPVLSQSGITKTSLWNHCKSGAFVRLDTVVGGHHTWFGSTYDPVPGVPNATAVVWSFFSSL